jgi:hypothetical protein
MKNKGCGFETICFGQDPTFKTVLDPDLKKSRMGSSKKEKNSHLMKTLPVKTKNFEL